MILIRIALESPGPSVSIGASNVRIWPQKATLITFEGRELLQNQEKIKYLNPKKNCPITDFLPNSTQKKIVPSPIFYQIRWDNFFWGWGSQISTFDPPLDDQGQGFPAHFESAYTTTHLKACGTLFLKMNADVC